MTRHSAYVKFEIATSHDGQDETERVFGLEGVGQVDHKLGVDLLQDELLAQHHGLALSLLHPFLFKLFARVHLARGSGLASTHLSSE